MTTDRVTTTSFLYRRRISAFGLVIAVPGDAVSGKASTCDSKNPIYSFTLPSPASHCNYLPNQSTTKKKTFKMCKKATCGTCSKTSPPLNKQHASTNTHKTRSLGGVAAATSSLSSTPSLRLSAVPASPRLRSAECRIRPWPRRQTD
jgi:hypothetical protein